MKKTIAIILIIIGVFVFTATLAYMTDIIHVIKAYSITALIALYIYLIAILLKSKN